MKPRFKGVVVLFGDAVLQTVFPSKREKNDFFCIKIEICNKIQGIF